ncbi:MAG: NAD(P)/FAD-dependent oxidoreductase [Chloroflexota bacterium]
MIFTPTMLEYDVAVIGAGPVGSHIASELAGLGYKVAVFDAARTAGENVCCTGIVSAECYQRFIAPLDIPSRPARAATVFSPSGQSLRIEKTETQAYIIDRPALNRTLAERGKHLGADYHFNSRVVSLEPSPDGCLIRLERHGAGDAAITKVAVVACGLSSAIPRKLGLGRIKYCAVGAQAEVKTGVDEVEIYFDQELAPGGFTWLVPTWNGNGLVGIVSRRSAAYGLKAFIERFRSNGKVTSVSAVRQKAIPMAMLSRTSSNRILVVGEAAGQVKPTTCGGIYTGMLSAELAVTTIKRAMETSDFSSRSLAKYDQAWRSYLGDDLRKGYLARRYYDTLSNRQIDNLFRTIQTTGLHEQLLGWRDFSFDWHGALLLRLVRQPRVIRVLLASGIGWSPRSLGALLELTTS